MLAPNSFFPPKRIKCPVLWRNDRRLFEEIVRNLWSFAKRQEQPRWMGAIPYWWLTTQTSQKAGSRFDFHTKSWFRVSSEPLPPPPDPHQPTTSGRTQIHNFRQLQIHDMSAQQILNTWSPANCYNIFVVKEMNKIYFGFLKKFQEFLFIVPSLGFPGS